MTTEKKVHPWKLAMEEAIREKAELAGGYRCPWCKHYAAHTFFMKEHWEKELVCTCNECQKNFFIQRGRPWKKFVNRKWN